MVIVAADKLKGLIEEHRNAIWDTGISYPREIYHPAYSLLVGDRREDQECAKLWGCEFKWAEDWRAEIR
jgi:hypothetical protein